jgi:hypothetical protein
MSSLLKEDYARRLSTDRIAIDRPAAGDVSIVGRSGLKNVPCWDRAFAHLRKDSRYYEIVEDTICPEFDYRYFVVTDPQGKTRAVQPFFILDQDLLAGASRKIKAVIDRVRRVWPRFLFMRTLMVGCAAGEGHLQATEWNARRRDADILAENIRRLACEQGAALIVLKEFPSEYRPALGCFLRQGFARIPSMPMTRLSIDYESFEDYMSKSLKSKARSELRKKFRIAEASAPIEMEVVSDVTPVVDDIFRLYLNVFQRSKLQFEKLTKEYFIQIGKNMPDKARFFLWRQKGRIIAFAFCLTEGSVLYGEYIGFDYEIALDIHLYFYVMRDIISWGIENGFKSIVSSGLSYAPKLHMRHVLKPLDLYVRHRSPMVNAILKRVLPRLEPTRGDKTLKKFANFEELWGKPS